MTGRAQDPALPIALVTVLKPALRPDATARPSSSCLVPVVHATKNPSHTHPLHDSRRLRFIRKGWQSTRGRERLNSLKSAVQRCLGVGVQIDIRSCPIESATTLGSTPASRIN